ncbi:MAG: DUF2752 domain-containing protein [Proteobacteria bacterium]|nr:DUF2752 domain-containing protein [Pseudomonadota bacterium]
MSLSATWIRGVHLALFVIFAAAWAVVGLTALAVAGALPETLERLAAFLTSCPFRAATGQPCPLCGVTTAALALLRGDVEASLALHPAALALATLAVSQPFYRLLRALRPRFSLYEELLVTGTGIVAAIVVIALA